MRARIIALAAALGAVLFPAAARAAEPAEVRMEEAARAFTRGDFAAAAAGWKEAAALYAAAGRSGRQSDALLDLGQAWHSLGQQRLAIEALEQALALATEPRRQLAAKAALGAVCASSPQAARAEPLLRESLELARAHDAGAAAGILNDLGNLLAAQGRADEARRAYEESAKLAERPALRARALANMAAAEPQAAEAAKVSRRAAKAIASLPDAHEKAALLLTAGRTWRRVGSASEALAAWSDAREIAERLGDARTLSYALGYLGELYAGGGRDADALTLTGQAVFHAQQSRAPEALFRWEWQKGRLLARGGERAEAIAAYRRALATVETIRHDIAIDAGEAGRRSSFREAMGPLFLEFADLLLQRSAGEEAAAEQRTLAEVRDTLERLKSAELVDYFQDDCVNLLRAKTASVEVIAPGAAVLYLVPLPDRTEVLLGLDGGLRRFTVRVGEAELTRVVRAFRQHLEKRTTYEYLREAWQLYDWLVRPLEPALAEGAIDTLVFVPDGALRTVPLQALHDGRDFLIARYAVAVTPGVTLMDARPLPRNRAKLLLNGLSEPVQGYAALGWVPSELAAIRGLYGGRVLADEHFRLPRFAEEFRGRQYSIVHIASHAEFQREARASFLLTYDQRLTLDDLERFIRPAQFRGEPVELVTLSACQTAAGDDRAALGLAGVAVKAGARSALATLWFVNDHSSSLLVADFYRQLHGETAISKARALQAAQLRLIGDRRYGHPCYWAPYLLIGNWL